ncbi:PD-(D/E)XK nuclease superfamily protein [Desulfitobacterium sp. LBE]|uniref:PDDEXK-like family protein n=1 Tax=Desulfitobacterium sp. LBE TaxID=884086 RepID=UPI00119B9CCC|nr:PD-(D/E)XK nuclease family protein [Desulfitobacterium sp. LBE]TWH59373.1 PD-(D/E)XK nuclease superfamily protein [Desulfitobacterium sp. LBE]
MKEKELIDKTEKIIEEYNSNTADDKTSFNIFTILREEDEEVMLHSRFIYELLNPRGSHIMKQKYLSLFLNVLENKAGTPLPHFLDEHLLTATVYRERFNIDLLIYLPDGYTMIIENKIYAYDQQSQLDRYFNTVVNQCRRDENKIFIVYLTLDGHEPTEQSKGKLKHDIYQISYASEIDHWLEMCCDESTKYPNLYETVMQYKRLVCQLSGKIDCEDGGMMSEIANLILMDKESLESAININGALNIAKSRVILQLFKALESEMRKAGYKKISSDEMELEAIENYYNAKEIIWQRYLVKSYSGNYEFCFAFEIDDRLYYYFAFTTKGECEIIEKADIGKLHPQIYKKCLNAIRKAHNIENIKRAASGSLIWDYIYDSSGKDYNFKRFSENCIELYGNIYSEAKRICEELTPIIRRVESEL